MSPSDELRRPFLEILARSRGRSVLIRTTICNEKNDPDPMPKILAQIGELKLTPIGCNAIPFGTSKLVMTVISQVLLDSNLSYNKDCSNQEIKCSFK